MGPIAENTYGTEKKLTADPRIPSTELGSLVRIELDTEEGRIEHRFAAPFPVLAYHFGGLLIAGGAYDVDYGKIVNRRREVETAPVRPEDMDAIEANVEQYAIDHWGQTGTKKATRLLVANPKKLSYELGKIVAITYRTKKGDDAQLTDYRHAFSRPLPILSHHDGGLLISGGLYRVEPRGIVD